MDYRSTRDVAGLLGVPPGRLAKAIWEGRVSAPAKGPGGAYLWADRDIEHASWILRHRDASDILPHPSGDATSEAEMIGPIAQRELARILANQKAATTAGGVQ